jgi:protein-L-isoaspartate(D-aspartate) O-methyltransferase
VQDLHENAVKSTFCYDLSCACAVSVKCKPWESRATIEDSNAASDTLCAIRRATTRKCEIAAEGTLNFWAGFLMADDPYFRQRIEMAETQLRKRGIKNVGVLGAMARVPRHEFVLEHFRNRAYSDEPLPIGAGQTVSQPYIVAAMTEALGLSGAERVLEVGTGCGYQTAVLSLLSREVYGVEFHPELATPAAERLERLGYTNAHIHCGDGSSGLKEFAPYDAILVAAAAPRVPEPLMEQLTDGGRLIAPVGVEERQELVLVTRRGSEYSTQYREGCRFVPLLGRYGWKDKELL